MTARPRVLIFDSGVGGLTVLAAARQVRPDARFVYAADNAAFPYGDLSEQQLIRRVLEVIGRLIEHVAPDVTVIACNTASTLALGALRDTFDLPFVGTVPAIKVAAETTRSGVVGVLATPATVNREYTKGLIAAFARSCDVHLVGARGLAAIAEAKLAGEAIDRVAIAREIAPAFVDAGGRRTDTIVLACTHYPLIAEEIAAAAPWPVALIDPSAAIARRITHFIGPTQVGEETMAEGTAVFTAPERIGAQLAGALARFGLTVVESIEVGPVG